MSHPAPVSSEAAKLVVPSRREYSRREEVGRFTKIRTHSCISSEGLQLLLPFLQ